MSVAILLHSDEFVFNKIVILLLRLFRIVVPTTAVNCAQLRIDYRRYVHYSIGQSK